MYELVIGDSILTRFDNQVDAARAAEWYRKSLKEPEKLTIRWITISEPRPGEVWGHFKGGVYVIDKLGHRAEDWERIVGYYTPETPDDLHVRTLAEWMSPHETGVVRFRKLANDLSEYRRVLEFLDVQKLNFLGVQTGRMQG